MSTTFASLGLPDEIVAALAKKNVTEPFPVQSATIPDALSGKDVSGRAPTGSGKTLAFGLPLIARVEKATKRHPRALVLAPTRELAEQIKEELAPIANAASRYVFAVYGGVPYGRQRSALSRGVDILVATPGRLEDLIEQRMVDLSQVDIVVVDEADRMADMGFLPAVTRILNGTSRNRQTLLFSATLDGDVAVLVRDYQNNPVRHETGTVEPETVEASHYFWLVDHHDRVEQTADLIQHAGKSIVFTRTRHGADRLAKQLSRAGVVAVAMHGGRSQNQRQRALKAFSSNRAQALIATDVAARGIHIEAVDTVIHFDPAGDHKDYLHRSGRTARAGATGTVVSLVTHQQKGAVRRLQKGLDLHVPIEKPELGAIGSGGYQRSDSDFNGGNRRVRDDRPEPARRKRTPDRLDRNGSASPSLFVGNLPWTTTDEDIHELFARHGEVIKVTVISDRRNGRSKGYGFVDMPHSDAKVAITELHGFELDGRGLKVRFAEPQKSQR